MAKPNGVPVVLSEDFGVGATLEGVLFLNPLEPHQQRFGSGKALLYIRRISRATVAEQLKPRSSPPN